MKWIWMCLMPITSCVWVPESDELQNGIDPPRTPIVSLTAEPRPATVGIDLVELSAEDTIDPDGEEVFYSWRFTDPNDVDFIVEGSGPTRAFTPNEVGQYNITVVATTSDGRRAQRSIDIPTYNTAPQVSLKSCTPGLKSLFYNSDDLRIDGDLENICIDLSNSYDLDGHTLSFRWEMRSVPPGAEDLLLAGTGPIARFRLPVSGNYMGIFFLDDGFAGTHQMRFNLHRL